MSNDNSSSMSIRRIRMKFHAKRALPGNWMRSIFLVLISTLAVNFCLSFILPQVDPNLLASEELNYDALLSSLTPTFSPSLLAVMNTALS